MRIKRCELVQPKAEFTPPSAGLVQPKAGIDPLTAGFTLIEILVVIAIVGILASILVPAAGKAFQAAKKRRAVTEMNSIKVAAMEFYRDHHYMPWPGVVIQTRKIFIGEDMWTAGDSDQEEVMRFLTGENPMKKVYLQIPEKSRPSQASMVFNDPWDQPYRIGLDRNLDGAVLPDATSGGGDYVKERVLVYSLGDPTVSPAVPMKTWD